MPNTKDNFTLLTTQPTNMQSLDPFLVTVLKTDYQTMTGTQPCLYINFTLKTTQVERYLASASIKQPAHLMCHHSEYKLNPNCPAFKLHDLDWKCSIMYNVFKK